MEKKSILVVEDDFKLSLALSLRLKSMDFEVFQAHDGIQALDRVKEVRPDLILMDISLPCEDGFSVAEAVYGIREHALTPIIFITASKKDGLREKASSLGASGFIEKPFDRDQIEEAIEKALAQSEEQREFTDFIGLRSE